MSWWPRSAARKSGAVPLVEAVDVGAVIEGELENAEVALARGDEVRALLRLVLRVDVGPGFDEAPSPVDVVVPGRGDQPAV
jgi:hypothetical protein